MAGEKTRERIVEAADRLFYHKGYEPTSFADIAEVVRISRGNFYHHFQTKDAILSAVIAARLARTRKMLERWEAASVEPAERIRSFIRILVDNRAKIKRHGCPVGTLCSELAKLDHDLRADAGELFSAFRDWLGREFTRLGHAARADELSMHVLARSQGIATLANAFSDERFLRREVSELCDWVDALASRPPGGRDASK